MGVLAFVFRCDIIDPKGYLLERINPDLYNGLDMLHLNNKGADQLVNPLSLISAFIIHFLESKIDKLVTCKFSSF